jgi:hypothetical protein
MLWYCDIWDRDYIEISKCDDKVYIEMSTLSSEKYLDIMLSKDKTLQLIQHLQILLNEMEEK